MPTSAAASTNLGSGSTSKGNEPKVPEAGPFLGPDAKFRLLITDCINGQEAVCDWLDQYGGPDKLIPAYQSKDSAFYLKCPEEGTYLIGMGGTEHELFVRRVPNFRGVVLGVEYNERKVDVSVTEES